MSFEPRTATKVHVNFYKFEDDSGRIIDWTPGQLEIIDSIIHRKSKDGKNRIQIIASTRYGKSLAVAAGVLMRAVEVKGEKWAIVAGTREKAQIIMDYVLMFATNNDIIRTQLATKEPLDRLRQSRSRNRLMFANKSEIRVFSADARQVTQTSKALMGFGSPNVVEDESALINDKLQATVMRMLGDNAEDNFLVKIGNPFNRNHFLRTWNNPRYHRVFIDWRRGVEEGRYTRDFIEEMREEDPFMFKINYECKFPSAKEIDESGWMYFFSDAEIEEFQNRKLIPKGTKRFGLDIARGGRDYNVLVMRKDNYAVVLKKWKDSSLVSVADILWDYMKKLNVHPADVFVDDTGVGGGVTDYLLDKNVRINPINFGERPQVDKDGYANLKAELYAGKEGLVAWLRSGAKLEPHAGWIELTELRFKKDFNGKIKMESKLDMRKRGLHSPDVADALALTFAKPVVPVYYGVSDEDIAAGAVKPIMNQMWEMVENEY